MITVSGIANLIIDYSVDLDMTEEEFDAMSEQQQHDLLDSSINWMNAYSQAEVYDIEVYEVEETEVKP